MSTKPLDIEKLKIAFSTPSFWAICTFIVGASVWAAMQWSSVNQNIAKMSEKLDRVELFMDRNCWTQQQMQVWSMENRRLNPDYKAPAIREIIEATSQRK